MTPVFEQQLWWYVARSGGTVALVLAAASVLWGLLLSSKYLAGGPRPKGLLNLHRFLGGLTVVFTGAHLLGLYLDRYVEFTVAELLVPLVSDWRPIEVALGVVAFWMLLAVQATSMIMRRLPRRLWKWIHLASYILLPIGIVHGVTAGTDAGTAWFRSGSAAIIGLLVWLTAWRSWNDSPRPRRSAPEPV